jgi:hypothetical protein
MKSKQTLCIIIVTLSLLVTGCRNAGQTDVEKTGTGSVGVITDSLPTVFADGHADIIAARFKNEAFQRFVCFQLPGTIQELERFRLDLKEQIIKKAAISIDHDLPLLMEETGSVKLKGYTVKNIVFQTLPGIFATANLYIPDGEGPFPAALVMHGHWREGRIAGPVQSVAHALALNGYVSMTIDAFGAGERSSIQGTYDYHGANPGASLMNIGKTLLGIQVSENMRAVDLLCSLPAVDAEHIGATGASGGGNQTMWLTAMDERVKASVPVVSVGTFESYIMESNCVCELMPDGLTLSEESGILALVAPRAILMCNHSRESNPTFFPSEMLRSVNNARPAFEMLGVRDNIGYRIFDLEHDYAKEDREAMLGWFDLHLKGIGNGEAVKEKSFKPLPYEQVMAYPAEKRDPKVTTLDEFIRKSGEELRKSFLGTKSFDINQKRNELRDILRLHENPELTDLQHHTSMGGWERIILKTSDDRLIPILHLKRHDKFKGYVILCDPEGKMNIPRERIDQLIDQGSGIVLLDLSGTGESVSTKASSFESSIGNFHTLSRADLWLGKTVLGEWVNELDVVIQFLNNEYRPASISIDGSREAGLAGLFYMAALDNNVSSLILREAPLSYMFDRLEGINFFTMAIHLPGFLPWGDISLAAAISGKNITFMNPVTMSGKKLDPDKLKEYQTEFDNIRHICRKEGMTSFNLNADLVE